MKRTGSRLQVRDKKTGQIHTIDGYWYTVENAYIIPLQCFYMSSYEIVEEGTIENKENI